MQRYFIKEKHNKEIQLLPEDIHHIKKVMRNVNGDEIICIDSSGHNYLCSISDIETGQVMIKEEVNNATELDIQVTLIYALPKGDKFDMVLQKATELGVHRIVPLQAQRCVVKTNPEKFSKKKVRYQKIVKEASEQSYRNTIPIIENVISIQDMEKYLGTYSIVAYEEDSKSGEHKMFHRILSKIQSNDSLTIIVGCEGGFEEQEIQRMEELGVHSCSLGKRILRSETAPLYMLSVIGYRRELGEKDGIV